MSEYPDCVCSERVCKDTHKKYHHQAINQGVRESDKRYTHTVQVSFTASGELVGEMIQHGASTLPGLIEVRAVLPPASLVLWNCHGDTQISVCQSHQITWMCHKKFGGSWGWRTPDEPVMLSNVASDFCQVFTMHHVSCCTSEKQKPSSVMFSVTWLQFYCIISLWQPISPGVSLGICSRLCLGSTWRHTTVQIKLSIAKNIVWVQWMNATPNKTAG